MRITNSMMVQTMIRNLNRNMVRLNDKQIQFSTGKRINKPSDDPLGISKSLRLRTDISVMEQYGKNVNDAYSFMDNTETALQNMLEGMQRIRELTVQASSATLTQEETSKMQAEIGEIRSQLTDLANYTYSGKNIFTGKKTGEALLDRDGNYLVNLMKATDPRMIDDKWSFEVSTRETIQVNTLGFEVFEAETREVVYNLIDTGDYLADPVVAPTNNWEVKLPLKEGNGEFVLHVVEDNTTVDPILVGENPPGTFTDDMPPTKLANGDWAVGAEWDGWQETAGTPAITDPAFLPGLIEGTFDSIGEIVGSLINEYTFEVVQRNELDTSTDPPTVLNDVQYLKAIPKGATISDNYEVQALWNSGQIGDITSDPAGPFMSGEPVTLTFNGVEITVQRGDTTDPAGSGTINPHSITDNNKATIIIDGDAPAALSQVQYVNAYVDALNGLATQRGSEVFGFQFSVNDDPDPTTPSIQAVAPERSGSLHNKATFGGTIGVATDREDQLLVEGTSPTRYTEAGQKAGLFAMLDELEANLLAGRQEELSNMLGRIDAHINTILTVRSEVGAKSNRMELITNRIEDDTLNFRDLMSKIEDADMSKVIIELMNEENVYRSALGVGARIIQPTLLDFLR